MKTWRKWLKNAARFSAHAILIGVPWIAIWGLGHPWLPAEQELPKGCWEHFLMGRKVSYTRHNGGFIRTELRAYVLLPVTADWPRLVTISQTEQEPPKQSQPSVLNFLVLLATYLFAAYGVWQTWFSQRTVTEPTSPAV